jgi:PEP-CTERM motif
MDSVKSDSIGRQGGWQGNFVFGFTAVPEPSSLILLMGAVMGIGFFRRRS